MAFPIPLNFRVPNLFNNENLQISINSGLLILVGPNGSGKTQFLRSLKESLRIYARNKKVRLLSAGRLSFLENYRSNYDGKRGTTIKYDDAQFGGIFYREGRHDSETAYGDFHTLSIRPDIQIKVSERLKKLFKRDIYIEWDAGNLKIKFNRISTQTTPYSSAREASGLLQLVTILSALYDDEVGSLLIDEPEISLHPQLQSFLFKELRKFSGDPLETNKKIVVLCTHSTEFIEIKKTEDIGDIIFFKDVCSPPKQIDLFTSELQNKKLKNFISRIGQSQKLAFFSTKPLLVEGESDAIICSALENKLNMYLGAAGSQIIPVIGKGQMPIITKFFKLIDKNSVIITDLDTLADGIQLINSLSFNEDVTKMANELGHSSVIDMASDIYNDFCNLINNFYDDIKKESENQYYWKFKKTTDNIDLIKKRSVLLTILNQNNTFFDTINNGEQWKSVKIRMESLLNLLSKAGCFILKKGSIENYFFSSPATYDDKPEQAIEEVEEIDIKDIDTIKKQYNDVILGIEYASNAPDINEAQSLSDLLLAVVAPIIGKFSDNLSEQEINALAYSILNERANLFRFELGENSDRKELIVNIESKILNVEGFPIKFDANSNPITEVKRKIKPSNY